jgi:hypothetical protein
VPALYDGEDLVEALSVTATLPVDEVLRKFPQSDVKRQFELISIVRQKLAPRG